MDINEIALELTKLAFEKGLIDRDELSSEKEHLVYAEVFNDILDTLTNK